MRKILVLLLLSVFALGCGSKSNQAIPGKKSKGELVGVKSKKYYPEKPFGMVLIPGGSFIMGKSDDDLPAIGDAPAKTVSLRSYYMDDTEITNAEYRQFVFWVRDSVIRAALAEAAAGMPKTTGAAGTDAGTENPMWQYKYLNEKQQDDKDEAAQGGSDSGQEEYSYIQDENILDWDVDITFNRAEYPSEEYATVLEDFFIPEDETFNEVRTWNVDKFKFEYKYSDVEGYINDREKYIREIVESEENVMPDGTLVFTREDITDKIINDWNPNVDFSRKSYINIDDIEIYPDTTTWIKDFKYSYNEPMHNDYFWHDAYSNYPVVGVTWDQANAFCQWRTKTKNKYQKTKKKKSLVPKFRLPTEAEWEYAARGGMQSAMYPWGGPYTKNDRGCFMANFKPMRGDYTVDQALYTVEANAYDPNGYNLYNMAGNVSEWTDSSYEEDAYEYSATMNPNVNIRSNQKKVIRGGSWKDVKYFLQVSSRDFEYKNTARSFIGFRTVHDYLGADMTANDMTNSTIRKQKNKRSSIK